MKTHVNIFTSPQAVAEAFAVFFQKWVADKNTFTVALSGGSTPKLLFRQLAEHYRERIAWDKLHFFWGDERCVPPDHADSNYRMTDEMLLRHIVMPPENIHRIRGEAEPVLEAERYAAEILDIVPLKDGWPAFDLILLGMGEDGHIASIFPDQMQLLDTSKVCAVATHPVSGQQRITLTGKVINHAAKVAFLVTGNSKRQVVKDIQGKTGAWEKYPAAHIKARGDLYWFMDEQAAH
ncbi:MAG: 6-phosphogluconolactonase [Lewinellaceae bacterium]|nr:6-phosphogluconolactonase [Saprospiraceae bacterium]MCB9339511.1 6-phosphogluconolactonase [Lewinellaceae bacterium]